MNEWAVFTRDIDGVEVIINLSRVRRIVPRFVSTLPNPVGSRLIFSTNERGCTDYLDIKEDMRSVLNGLRGL
jgi:hypothetical protein